MSELADILRSVQKSPGMWFGHRASIHDISSFITGFQHGQRHPPDPLSFEYFTRWVAAHYRVVDGPRGGFQLILEHVGGDEYQAADEFFRLLPLYPGDMAQLGGEDMHAHYGKVLLEIRNAT